MGYQQSPLPPEYEILETVKDPFGGMLYCLYAIRFKCRKELNNEQKDSAFRCLNVIAEDEKNPTAVRAWCYNQLGLIHSGRADVMNDNGTIKQ